MILSTLGSSHDARKLRSRVNIANMRIASERSLISTSKVLKNMEKVSRTLPAPAELQGQESSNNRDKLRQTEQQKSQPNLLCFPYWAYRNERPVDTPKGQ